MCSINVTSAVFDQDQNTLTVNGNSDCQSISINILNLSIAASQANVVDGSWEVIFNSNEISLPSGFSCDQEFKFNVRCVEDANCSVDGAVVVSCKLPTTTCPDISIEIVSISECSTQGLRTVDFSVTSSLNEAVAMFNFGDNTESEGLVFPSGNPINISHVYSSGTYIAAVNILTPVGCQDITTQVVIPECPPPIEETPEDCPTVIVWEIEASNGNRYEVIDNIEGVYRQINNNPNNTTIDCLPAETYTLRLTEPSGNNLQLFWRDNNGALTTSNTFQLILDSGEEHEITVTVQKENCFPLSEAIVIKSCGCIETDWSEWSDCIDCVQTRERTLADCTTETETQTCEGESEPTPFTDWTPSGFCRLTRSMRNSSCVEIVETKTNWCCIWLLINIILTIGAIIAIIVAGCVYQWIEPIATTIAITLGSVTILSWILWGIFCVLLKRRNPTITCPTLIILIEILDWLETIAAIIVFLLVLFGQLPCAIAFASVWGLIALVKKYLRVIAQIVGCLSSLFFRNRII